MKVRPQRLFPAIVAVMLAAGAGCHFDDRRPAEFELLDAAFEDIPGWAEDNLDAALATFLVSCEAIERQEPDQPLGLRPAMGPAELWQERCRLARNIGPGGARAFFEAWFQPWLASGSGDTTGLFTGYYEPLLSGSRVRTGTHRWPLYRMPSGLASIPERAAIDAGALEGMGLELLWVDDPVDAFFLHVQGSGRVRLADGTEVRVGYAGKNGHPYRSIGRELADRGAIPIEEVTMPSIRAWLDAHPDQAFEIMATNRSYVFFHEIEGEGPVGAQGVPLTPGRSLAVDDSFFAYGVPVWLSTTLPSGESWQRLMVAQDTGGAITGPVRGDVFFGGGVWAERMAGSMKASGSYWILLPNRIPVSLVAQAVP